MPAHHQDLGNGPDANRSRSHGPGEPAAGTASPDSGERGPGPGESPAGVPAVPLAGVPAEPAAGVLTAPVANVPAPPPEAAGIFGPALPLAERYAALLAGPGVERGLLGPREAERLWDRHLLNCAVLAALVPHPATLVDIGSGAGLPGLVLALLLPDVTITLVEPMARRISFLEECVEALALANVSLCRARAEEVHGQFAADVVTARAVAPLDRLAGLALPLARPGGIVLAVKGERASAEADAAAPLLRRLGVTDVSVLRAGAGQVDPPATVVRLVAPPPAKPGRSSPPRRQPPRGDRRGGVQRGAPGGGSRAGGARRSPGRNGSSGAR